MPLATLREKLLAEPLLRQGPHPDPGDPGASPPDEHWRRALMATEAMAHFRTALADPVFGGMRETVLGELGAYWQRGPAEVLDRCLNWEDYSVEEWKGADRDTPEGLLAFYQQCESWTYDLLWNDYLRAVGYSLPASVVAAHWLTRRAPVGRHLDFGSGAGTTSQMFAGLGWQTSLGDVSMVLLDFARWRLDRHGTQASYLDLRQPLPAAAFDAVTAVDTLFLVPDALASARELHAAMRPGGYLFADFDVRPPSEHNAWHLYDQAHALRWALARAGFTEVDRVAGGITICYRRDPITGLRRRWLLAAAWLRLGPPALGYRRQRARLIALARKVARRLLRPDARLPRRRPDGKATAAASSPGTPLVRHPEEGGVMRGRTGTSPRVDRPRGWVRQSVLRVARASYRRVERSRFSGLAAAGPVRRLRSRYAAATASDVLDVLDALSAEGVPAWVAGGWGIDALLGEQTRTHHDLDVVLELRDGVQAAVVRALAGHGYQLITEERFDHLPMPVRWVMNDGGGRTVDLLPVSFTDSVFSGDETSVFSSGLIAGRVVPCLSVPVQLQLHAGYGLDESARRDVTLLHERFAGSSRPAPPE